MSDYQLRRYVGTWDMAQGTVTDESGVVRTYGRYIDHVRDDQRKTLKRLLEQRDITRDDQNLPGDKPWFADDWMGHFPAQVKPVGTPYELGYRSPAPES